MVRQIILYFFTVFGIVEFLLFFWEMLRKNTVKDLTATVIKTEASFSEIKEMLYILRKYPLKIYIVAENEENEYKILEESYPDFKVVTNQEFSEIINGEKNGKNIGNS